MGIESGKCVRSLVSYEIKHSHIYHGYGNFRWHCLSSKVFYFNAYLYLLLGRIFLLVGNNLYVQALIRRVNRELNIAYFEGRFFYIFF